MKYSNEENPLLPTAVDCSMFGDIWQFPVNLKHTHPWRDDQGHFSRPVKTTIQVIFLKHWNKDKTVSDPDSISQALE